MRRCVLKGVDLVGTPHQLDKGRVSMKTLGPEGVDLVGNPHRLEKGASASRGGFGGEPTSIGERSKCQRGHWALKEGGL